MTQPPYTSHQKKLIDVWERHTSSEFESKDADAAIATMTACPSLNHVPVSTGAAGREEVRRFYAEIFIPQTPPDLELQLLHRTVTDDRIIDEFILHLTHSIQMDWFAPGIAATGKKVVLPHVGVITFEDELIASERIYWDHASLLVQLGVLDGEQYPVMGSQQADRMLDVNAKANALIEHFAT